MASARRRPVVPVAARERPSGGATKKTFAMRMVVRGSLVITALCVSLWPLGCFAGPQAQVRFGVVEPPVVAQMDITIAAPKSPLGEQAPIECSSAAWLDGSLLLTSDRHEHLLFTCPIPLDTMQLAPPQPLVVLRNEQDMLLDCEALAVRRDPRGRRRVYAMCSLSNDRAALPLPRRRHMARVLLEPSGGGGTPDISSIVIDLDPLRRRITEEFGALGVEPYRAYYADHAGPDKNTYRWGNVEGMDFAPAGGDDPPLLCGMRNPLLNDRAIVCVVGGIDAAFDARDAGRMTLRDVFTLDLGGRGISDLTWDPVTRGYLISAADSNGPRLDDDRPYPPNTLRAALFWWSGNKTDNPLLFAEAPDMKIEAICRLGESRFIAIVSDEGDESESRTSRQSVLTVMDFTGISRPAAGGARGTR